MNLRPKAWFCGVSILVAATAAYAIVNDGPYKGIADRNVFGLRPPPAPPDTNQPVAAPPAKIILSGITTILGKKMVLVKIQSPGRPGQPVVEQSHIMTVGERQGEVEVLEIDEIAGAIKFNNHGQVVTLTMEKDGAKLPNTPPAAAPAAPGTALTYANPGAPGSAGQVPVFNPANAGMQGIPPRTIRQAGTGGPGGIGGQPGYGGYPQQGMDPQQAAQSREEQIIRMEIERERTKNHVAEGQLPPLPPTELSPNDPAPQPQLNQQPTQRLPTPPGFPPAFPR